MNNHALNRNLIERVALGDLLRKRSRDSGEQPAIVDFPAGERRATSYNELNKRVNQLAHGLIAKGVKQGDKLALFSTNQRDMLTVYFACYKLGVIAVPINFMQGVDDVRYNLEHSETSAVVYEAMFAELVHASTEDNPHIKLTVQMGNTKGKSDYSLEALLDNQSEQEINDRIIEDRDTAHMIYTSGTTSRPKAVESSHLALTIAALTGAIELELNRYNRMLLVLPLFHCAALSVLHPVMMRGGCTVLHAAFDPNIIVDSLEQEKIETAVFMPMMWHALLATPNVEQRDFKHFKLGVYSMAAMNSRSLEKVRKTFGCVMHLGSGQTEFAPVACMYRDKTPTEFSEGNYWGEPVCTGEQAIIDKQGNELPNGEAGEIVWRGPQVMSGYYKNEQATAEAGKFGWHHTGDIGLIDNQGQLLFIDRIKDTIKSGGENVSSQKVEQALELLEGIERAAAFGVSHPHWGEAVCACIISATLNESDIPQIEAHCKAQLGQFEVPKAIFICETLPVTGTGKIRKVELRAQYKDLFIPIPVNN
ncbi:class I adenylate-forming enzyme family protein [Paraglaciecola chathamensis]|uniref:Acyl-CoA synthetase n=1 Tax=Paraglaciecola chathamensis TaxID=368405 RepID=A0A8H9M5H6_9ALTE|nr:class I adenylate-forming enzyme family protein [Paraglaciecola oceanifecundans]GGZ79042.1 acyl-CoA synthetase [Paraglaciecola oceanifecundans]